MSGSQGNVKFRLINDRQVAIKETKYDDRSLELEARVSKLITEKCPELIDFFPELISFRDNQLITTRILGEELCDMISRVRRANCRNLRAKSVQIIRNICQIILCVMETVTRKTGIVHNDLHASNVIISKTTNETFTFNFDNDKTYTIKSYGYIPVIIDFGYAHIEGELLGSLQNSDIGYTLEYKDRLADARLILRQLFKNSINI
jgi:serine/threonine protein kinase